MMYVSEESRISAGSKKDRVKKSKLGKVYCVRERYLNSRRVISVKVDVYE